MPNHDLARGAYAAAREWDEAWRALITVKPSLVVPATAMSAFAIEVYLKALLLTEVDAPPRGHKAKELFDRLQPGTRERLCSRCPVDLDRQMMGIGDAFVWLRYWYEYAPGQVGDGFTGFSATAMTDTLRALVEERLGIDAEDWI